MSLAKSRRMRVISGIPVYAVYGAEETEEERKKRESEESESTNKTETEENSESEDAPRSEPDRDARDVETYKQRAAAADRAKGEMERKYNALVDKEKSDLERANSKLEEANQNIERVTKQRNDAVMRAEILKFPGYSWHDPEAVLSLIDSDSIQIDDDGKVTGVKDAIQKLAKDKPYLLKNQQEEQKPKEQPKQQTPSGSAGSNGNSPDEKNEQRSKLVGKYKLLQN